MYKVNDVTNWLSQTTDNSKYFVWSPGLWDKESRLYIQTICTSPYHEENICKVSKRSVKNCKSLLEELCPQDMHGKCWLMDKRMNGQTNGQTNKRMETCTSKSPMLKQVLKHILTTPYEPRHEKICLCHMWTIKVQISLCIRAVWSAPLLFTARIVQYLYLL